MRDGKGREENKGENDVFPCLVQERNTQRMENIGEKNPTGLPNFYPPDLGGKLGRKERKGELST